MKKVLIILAILFSNFAYSQDKDLLVVIEKAFNATQYGDDMKKYQKDCIENKKAALLSDLCIKYMKITLKQWNFIKELAT